MDVAAKADNIGKAKIAKIGEQLVVAEATIGLKTALFRLS